MTVAQAPRAADGPINRTLRVLSVLCERGPSTLSELSVATGLTPSTLLRILRLMQCDGYAAQVEEKRWRATFRLWQLGCAVNDSVGLRALTDSVLRGLADSLDETVVYAAYDSGCLTYSATAVPEKPFRAHVRLGGRHGLLDTRTGRAVLANLSPAEVDRVLLAQPSGPPTRGDRQQVYRELVASAQRGYSAGFGGRWPGLWAVAAPVFDDRSRPVGAVGVSVPASSDPHLEPPRAAEFAQHVVAAARELTAALGGPVTPPTPPLLTALVARRGRGRLVPRP